MFPLHWLSWAVSFTGIILVLAAHGHYTVDVLIAYYVTTTLFWIYHTLANYGHLKVNNITILETSFEKNAILKLK